MYRQKDIILIPFPYSDLSGAKLRPALIISNESLQGEDIICSLITTNPTQGILLKKSDFVEGELPFKSYLKSHRVFTVHKEIIKKKLCTVNDELFDRVLKEIENYLCRL